MTDGAESRTVILAHGSCTRHIVKYYERCRLRGAILRMN